MYCFLHLCFTNVIIFVNNPSRSYSTFIGADLEYPISLSYIRSSWSELRYFNFESNLKLWCTALKMKFSIKDFFSKCDQICRKPWIWSHLPKKFLMENFILCAMMGSWLRFWQILVTSGGFQGFSRRFLSFEIWKVRASVYVTIYTIMYNITVRIYVKNYCKSLLVY